MASSRGLQTVTTGGSTYSRNNKVASRQKSRSKSSGGFFSAIKAAFSGGSDDSGSAVSKPASRSRSRGLSSGFMMTASERQDLKDKEREAQEEAVREARRSKCMAIKVAKREPLAIQKLLVDCEFCNPPPNYGVSYFLISPEFTARDNHGPPENVDESDERTWNVGLDQWLMVRQRWLRPDANSVNPHYLDADITPDKYYAIYDKMIHHTRPVKHPLNLSDMVKIIKAGWVSEGTWPAQADPDDVWSTSEGEDMENDPHTAANANGNGNANELKVVPARATSAAPSEETMSDRVEHKHTSLSPTTSRALSQSLSAAVASNSSSSIGTSPAGSNSNSNSAVGQSGPSGLSVPGAGPSGPGSGSGPLGPTPTLSVTDTDSQRQHVVQFKEKPHPRKKGWSDKADMPQLERLVSGMSMNRLRPTRSEASSLVSMTDSD